MTLDEAIDEQFKNLSNEDPVYVRVHCAAVIPGRAGYRTKYFFTYPRKPRTFRCGEANQLKHKDIIHLNATVLQLKSCKAIQNVL